ncbi:MAG TPA: MBL fold metallo-hydrolase, partial [Candidatus Acidoferrales bacterium]|nr:MBL fold metallo-hydrolase [Candidatus Acidoferrales bacterium]
MLRTRGNKITWLGHSAFRITTPSGQVILIDPWVMGNPSCPEAFKKVEKLDVMLITHGHGDHLGDAVALARAHKPLIVAIYETCLWFNSKGIHSTLPMSKGGTQKAGEIEVTMVHALHSCGIEDEGKIVYGGEPCG